MHRGGPGIAAFEQVSGLSPELYQTPDLIGYPGMSGGPVCVLSYTSLSNLFLLPAAVYLGELENGQSLARVIDLDVVNLINSAEDSATLGTDHTGGGVVLINAAYGGDIQNPGIVEVHLGPSAAIRAGGAWRVSPTNYGNLFYRTNYTTNSLNLLVQSANFGIEVKQLDGFITPTSLPIKVVEDAIVPLELMYSVPQPWLTYNWSNGVGFTTTGAVSTVYGIEFASHLPGDALNDWTMLTKVTNYPSLGGTNWIWIPNTAPTSVTNRLFRARWLTD